MCTNKISCKKGGGNVRNFNQKMSGKNELKLNGHPVLD